MRQIITKAGAANIPPWYDAGKVWLQEHPAFPFGAPLPWPFVRMLGWHVRELACGTSSCSVGAEGRLQAGTCCQSVHASASIQQSSKYEQER